MAANYPQFRIWAFQKVLDGASPKAVAGYLRKYRARYSDDLSPTEAEIVALEASDTWKEAQKLLGAKREPAATPPPDRARPAAPEALAGICDHCGCSWNLTVKPAGSECGDRPDPSRDHVCRGTVQPVHPDQDAFEARQATPNLFRSI